MNRTAFPVLLLLASTSAAMAAPPIGYAQATGYYKKETRPTLYQPLNLLDGREATAWCTPTSDPLDEQLTFGFKGSARIDEIRVYTGNGFDESTFEAFSRAKKLLIKGPAGAQTVTVADQRGQQVIQLDPPLEGAQFIVKVLDLYPAADPEAPVCITDIVFCSGGKPLNGPWLTRQLKYDRARAPLLGTWFAGSEGAPDKYLSFYFDGTWRFVYDPWDPAQKGQELEGAFDPSGARLTLEVRGGKKTSVRIRREGNTLVLDGEVPPEMKVTFRDVM